MTKKKWAMVIMGEDYDPEVNRARLDTEKKEGHILTVRDPKEALSLAAKLKEEALARTAFAIGSSSFWQPASRTEPAASNAVIKYILLIDFIAYNFKNQDRLPS